MFLFLVVYLVLKGKERMSFENETNLSLCQMKKESVVWESEFSSSWKIYVLIKHGRMGEKVSKSEKLAMCNTTY